jgi:hypothetical protein
MEDRKLLDDFFLMHPILSQINWQGIRPFFYDVLLTDGLSARYRTLRHVAVQFWTLLLVLGPGAGQEREDEKPRFKVGAACRSPNVEAHS